MHAAGQESPYRRWAAPGALQNWSCGLRLQSRAACQPLRQGAVPATQRLDLDIAFDHATLATLVKVVVAHVVRGNHPHRVELVERTRQSIVEVFLQHLLGMLGNTLKVGVAD